MNPERRQEIESLFEAALERPDAERAAWLASHCSDDRELLEEVEALLAAHQRAEGILESDVAKAAASIAVSDPLLNERIGPYRIVGELGRGGMGIVYRAQREDGQFRRTVAIKVVHATANSHDLQQRFQAERQILATLDHPHIAQLLDGGLTGDGRPYLVLEQIEGVPIDEYCDRKRLPIDERLRLFCTVARTVHYAHQNLVVHRDIKPSNIFVTSNGAVKLLDFGIAKILDPSLVGHGPPVTRTGIGLMTPEYASPEQVLGGSITTATDIYSLGVVLYELLTGRRPYRIEGLPIAEWARRIVNQEPLRPSDQVGRREKVEGQEPQTELDGVGRIEPREIPRAAEGHPIVHLRVDPRSFARGTEPERLRRRLRGELDRIVLKALAKEPERRYASAQQFAEDIERHLQGLPVIAHKGSRWYQLRKFVARHRMQTAAVVAVVLSLLGGAALAVWQASVARRARDRAEVARAQAEEALAQSEEVTGFLIGLFEASDPTEAQGDTVAAREVLRRGVARAEELAAQPAAQARMFDALGRVYVNLGQYAQARSLLERALALRRATHPSDHPDVAESLDELATLLRRTGDYERAEALYREALAMRRRLFGDLHPSIATSLAHLGFLMPYRGRLDDAEDFYREALAIRRETLGPGHPLVGDNLVTLASVLRRQGDYDESEQLYREALALRRTTTGDENPTVAATMIHLADFLKDHRGEYAEAEQLYREAVAMLRRSLGDNYHPTLMHGLHSLADLLATQGRNAEAEALVRERLALTQKVFGSDHPAVASSIELVASHLSAQGKHRDAEMLRRRALAIWQNAFGREHYVVAGSMSGLADVLVELGEYDEAESLYREAVAIVRKTLDPNHPILARRLRSLAALLTMNGRHDEAERYLLEALNIMTNQYNVDHPEIRYLYRELAEFYDSWGRPQLADRFRRLSPTE